MQTRLMLAMSFFNNIEDALKTARAFATQGCGQMQVVLGLETEAPREAVAQRLLRCAGAWDEIWLWDKTCDPFVLSGWRESGLPNPFYTSYSYGGAVNRLHALAKVAGCTHLVRVDPNSWPPSSLAGLLDRHVKAAQTANTVSGQYHGRVALRDEFVRSESRAEYYQLIQQQTGVDPRRGKQLTGGAAFTFRVGVSPALPFDGAMVWASDDGFFQVIDPGGSMVDPTSLIGRDAPGYPLSWKQYISRLANAVILRECHLGNREPEVIQSAVRGFLKALAPLLNPEHVSALASINPMELPLHSVLAGYDNYLALRATWTEVLSEIERRTSVVNMRLRAQR